MICLICFHIVTIIITITIYRPSLLTAVILAQWVTGPGNLVMEPVILKVCCISKKCKSGLRQAGKTLKTLMILGTSTVSYLQETMDIRQHIFMPAAWAEPRTLALR